MVHSGAASGARARRQVPQITAFVTRLHETVSIFHADLHEVSRGLHFAIIQNIYAAFDTYLPCSAYRRCRAGHISLLPLRVTRMGITIIKLIRRFRASEWSFRFLHVPNFYTDLGFTVVK